MTKPPYVVFETVEEWDECIGNWIDDSQYDILSWLCREPELRRFSGQQRPWIRNDGIRSDFHLWCLGHNLAVAGALSAAQNAGFWAGHFEYQSRAH